jgi:membrane-associated protease RseP (regulator of RpoE activity)
MSEQRFSIWQVIGFVVAILGLCAVALGGGAFFGYQWGRAAGRAQALAYMERVDQPGEVLPWPLPGRKSLEVNNFPYLGVQFEMITPELAKTETLAADTGAILREVMPDSPAERAGLKVGDIIQQVDGETVDASNTLRDRIATHKVGDEVTLGVLRGGETLEVKVTLAESSDLPSFFPPDEFPSRPGFKFDFRCEPGPCPFFPSPDRLPRRNPTY